jgi:hypothetical protein
MVKNFDLNEFHTLSTNPWFSVRECPKILKICQITNFDMSFQKKNVMIFFHRRFSRETLLKNDKKLQPNFKLFADILIEFKN